MGEPEKKKPSLREQGRDWEELTIRGDYKWKSADHKQRPSKTYRAARRNAYWGREP